jgi:hypothetical protein
MKVTAWLTKLEILAELARRVEYLVPRESVQPPSARRYFVPGLLAFLEENRGVYNKMKLNFVVILFIMVPSKVTSIKICGRI